MRLSAGHEKNGMHTRTRVPGGGLNFLESDAKELLVDVHDDTDDFGDWEVFFHEGVIQRKSFFNEKAIIIAG